MKKKILTVAALLIASFTFVAGMDTTAYSKVVEARFGGGMYDEEEMLKEEKPVDKVEHIEKKEVKKETKKTKKAAKKKTKKNKKSTKKDKKKNAYHRLTEAEAAAEFGLTLEEFRKLSDKEKYGTIEGSTAGEKMGGKYFDFDWD